MSKITIIEGNSNDKDNTRVYMVKGEKGYSAYDLYVQQGGTLTEEEWLDAFLNANNFYNKSEVDDLLSGKADTEDLSAVATSGSYNDLEDKPTIPSANNEYSDSTTNPYSADFINGTVVYEGNVVVSGEIGFPSGVNALDYKRIKIYGGYNGTVLIGEALIGDTVDPDEGIQGLYLTSATTSVNVSTIYIIRAWLAKTKITFLENYHLISTYTGSTGIQRAEETSKGITKVVLYKY